MDTQLLKLREQVLIAGQARTAVRLRGNGTKDFYGEQAPDASSAETLDLRAFTGIVDYEPSELVITARCGTPLKEIEDALAERGQFLGFEPPDFGGEPTFGGVIATGLSGPRRMQVGAARDFVLGAHLLVADGELLRFGGQVMKNVAGFDVSRLLCGSLGIFGILTEISVKVLPKPRAEQTLRLEMPAQAAIDAFNRWGGLPLPVSAAAWHEGAAWVRLSGAAPAIRSACEQMGGERVDEAVAAAWWNGVRHCTHAFFESASIWRVSVPSTAPVLNVAQQPLIDWGGALRWYAGDLARFDVRKLAAATGGTAAQWRGAGAGNMFHPVTPAIAQIHRRLKQSFDPHGIFNPGRLLAGL